MATTTLQTTLSRFHDRLGLFSQRVHHHEVVDSTNEVAGLLAQAGAPEGTVVIADAQTAGRGRQGRAWHSPKGLGLYASLVLRPAERPPIPPFRSVSLLTLGTGVALADALRGSTDIPVDRKSVV